MISGTRGCEAYHRSNSERWSGVGACAAAAGSPEAATLDATSRGKKASVEAAPAKNSTATIRASGLATKTRRSRYARRGNEVMGKVVAAPDTRKSPITAAYVVRHSRQTALSSTNEAYARYRITASAS